jgi:hypothetical protein
MNVFSVHLCWTKTFRHSYVQIKEQSTHLAPNFLRRLQEGRRRPPPFPLVNPSHDLVHDD